MRKKFFLYIFLFQALILMLLTGCKKDFKFDKVKAPIWEPDLALPLVQDNMTFESGITKSGTENNFIIDESGNISILYYFNNDAFRIKVDELLQLPSYSFSFTHLFTLAEQQVISVQDLILPIQTYTLNLTQDLPGIRIDKILIKEGEIVINTNHTFNNPGNLTVSFPEATKNGVPFIATLSSFVQGPDSQVVDLSGVLFDLRGNPGQVTMKIGGVLKKSTQPGVGDVANATFNLDIKSIGRFEGFLGQKTIDQEEDFVRINLFNNAYSQGTIYFEDPSVTVTVINSIGIPTRITIKEIKSVNLNSNVSLDITPLLGSSSIFDVPTPLITDTKPVSKTVEFNNANTSNSMNPFFNLKPDRIYYKIQTMINPANVGTNFFSDTSSFHSKLNVMLPLYGYFDNLIIQDTFDFSLGEQENVESAKLRTKIVNGIPLLARMQVYFTDDAYRKIDSLTGNDNIVIQEAPVDPATHLPYPGQFGVKDTSYFLDQQRIKKLHGAKKMLVRAVLNSSGNGHQNVKIKADQALKLNFSAFVKLRANINK